VSPGVSRAVLLVDHGSRRAEANAVLDDIAELLHPLLPARAIRVAHMELAEPTVAQGIDACVAAGADEVTVVPYFLGPGSHAARDIPRLVEAAAARHPGLRVRVAEPLGVHERLAELVALRVAEAER